MPVARAESSGLLWSMFPVVFDADVEFISEMESLTVDADRPAKIVINERTGTIVMGKDVKITPVAIMHGALSVESAPNSRCPSRRRFLEDRPRSFPKPRSRRRTPRRKRSSCKRRNGGGTVRALQAIGSTPRDVLAILQAMRSAGALDAEIEVI